MVKCKKTIYLFLQLLLFYSLSFAQIPFINFKNNQHNAINGSIELPLNRYALIGRTGNALTNNYKAYVLKSNSNGFITDTLLIEKFSSSAFTCGVYLNTNQIAFFGQALENDTIKNLFVLTDLNLNVLSIKLTNNTSNEQYPQTVRLKNDTIILTGHEYNRINQLGTPFIIKLNFNLDVLQTKYVPLIGDNWGWQSIEMNNKIKLTYLSINRPERYGTNIINTDLNFENIIDDFKLRNKMPFSNGFVPDTYLRSQSYIKKFNDSIYFNTCLFEGMHDEQPYTFIQNYVGITKSNSNKNDTIEKIVNFGKKDTLNNPCKNSFDFVTTDNIYVGFGSGANKWSHFPDTETKTSYGCITKVDSNLNIIWQKYFGGDYHYLFTNFMATSDGGAMLMGFYSDFNNLNYTSKIVAFKLDKYGNNINGVGIKDEITSNNKIILSPNPASDIITATFPENTYKEIGLINMQGETIFKTDLQSNLFQFKINVNSFASGTYSVYFKEKETGFGIAKKIIIQH